MSAIACPAPAFELDLQQQTRTAPAPAGRKISPDFVKGVAICLMVYGHLELTGHAAAFQDGIVAWIYTFHMPLFLLISGYFFRPSEDAFSSLGKLGSRLVRPYLLFSLLYLTGLLVAAKIGLPTTNAPPSTIGGFLEAVLLRPKGGFWFLHTLFFIQLSYLLPGLVAEFFNLKASSKLALSVVFWVVCLKLGVVSPRNIMFFSIGFALGKFRDEITGSILLGVAGMVVLLMFSKAELFAFSIPHLGWVLSILSVLTGLADLLPEAPLVRLCAWMGRNSLAIFVFHPLFLVALKPAGKLFLKLDPSGIGPSLLVTVVALLGSLLAVALVDRSRLSPLLFGTKKVYSPLRQMQRAVA